MHRSVEELMDVILSKQIAAHAHGKIAVFEPALLGKLQKEKTAWRVHSSFAVGRGEKKVHVMDYAGGESQPCLERR